MKPAKFKRDSLCGDWLLLNHPSPCEGLDGLRGFSPGGLRLAPRVGDLHVDGLFGDLPADVEGLPDGLFGSLGQALVVVFALRRGGGLLGPHDLLQVLTARCRLAAPPRPGARLLGLQAEFPDLAIGLTVSRSLFSTVFFCQNLAKTKENIQEKNQSKKL